MLHGSQGIHDQFAGDPWIHFCDGYFDVYFVVMAGIVKCNRGTSLIGDVFTSYDR
jgi:hypothetical protein